MLFPCVYLIDFETAVSFPAELRLEDRLVLGHYFGNNLKCPLASEQKNKGIPFNPFALDVWQLAKIMIVFSICALHIDCRSHLTSDARQQLMRLTRSFSKCMLMMQLYNPQLLRPTKGLRPCIAESCLMTLICRLNSRQ